MTQSTSFFDRRPGHRAQRLLALISAVVLVALAVIDVITGTRYNPSIVYPTVLVVCWWIGTRWSVWSLALFAAMLTVVAGAVEGSDSRAWVHRLMTLGTLGTAAVAIDVLLRHRRSIEAANVFAVERNRELEAANQELAVGAREAVRQNEALHLQSKTLERQGEELLSINEEMGRNERTLKALLALSRSLRADLTHEDTIGRVCETLSQLVDDSHSDGGLDHGTAAAVFEVQGSEMVVSCHSGFGDGPLDADRFPEEQLFSSLVLARDCTDFLEDVSLRPDLKLPQGSSGDSFVSVLAAPLRIGGRPMGTIEAYSRTPGRWDDRQVAMIESLAAQASISLEAADLYNRVVQERARFETVIRTLPFGVMICNFECTDVRLNPAGAAILNAPADVNILSQLAGGEWSFFREGVVVEFDQYPIIRAIREGRPVHSGEYEIRFPTGRRGTLLIDASPFLDATEKVIGAVAAFADITMQRELQREIDTRRREAEEDSVRKTRFLAAISHDIRTPANAIGLMAELIRRSAANPAMMDEIPEMAQELHGSATSLLALLSDVLDVARFDSGKIDMQETEFSLPELLHEQQRLLLPLAREKRIDLSVGPTDDIRLFTDRIKLGRVIDNLLGNGIKFTDIGSVRVEAEETDSGSAKIRVIDTGLGIEAASIPYIFDEFVQLRNPERDRSKGTGLGLAICQRLVQAMGGSLAVHSEPGKGSIFTVTLPQSAVVASPGVASAHLASGGEVR